ncbi:MAG: hypothetical protein Ct9H300mP13_6190 [Gammaproteobacteria bacterium]|nr:MAG: hypothetical protein Ct9H300mP13_6190 [Gammaproteobacteria bacterium]
MVESLGKGLGCANQRPLSINGVEPRWCSPEETVFLDDFGINLKPARPWVCTPLRLGVLKTWSAGFAKYLVNQFEMLRKTL